MKNLLIQSVIEMMERGWLPDSITRSLVGRLVGQRLASLNQRAADSGAEAMVQELVTASRNQPLAPVPEKANEQHYEVPAEFYDLVLGPRKKYSCCLFADETTTLAEAEVAALAATCERAEIEDGQDILELGCGWGSLTLWLAEKYPHSRITAVSNSHSQRQHIESKLEQLQASDRVEIITCDMNDFSIEKTFDRVVSLEMFEHMRNYELLFSRIDGWLRDDGKLFVHVFAHDQFAYEFQTEGASNWMGRYFFTGGIMPSADLFSHFDKHFEVTQQWRWNGVHYQRTCAAWRELMEIRKPDVLQLLGQVYGRKDANRWFNRWKMFFIAGEELFGFENGNQWCVMHYLFEKSRAADNDLPEQTSRVPQTAGV